MSAAVRFVAAVAPPGPGWPGPVSFEVRQGGFVLIKALQATAIQLIRLTVGLREPVSGTVAVLGKEPGRLGRWDVMRFRRRLGVAFHEPSGLVSNLDLETNLVVTQVYSGLRRPDAAHEAADRIMARLGLAEWRRTRPADLTPELRREAAVARALVRDPELAILEEPTDGLDPVRAERLIGLCREHADTIMIVSSEQDDVLLRAADRTILIDGQSHEMGVV
jgi:ABC-type multidrug transport system ATPase subunit